MKLLSYHGTRPGIMGLGNWAIRKRLGGDMSHSEIMFGPDDDVDKYMPDKTTAPNAAGELWAFSSVGLEKMPEWSPRRAGHIGGMRFKRINPNTEKWTITPIDHYCPYYAANLAMELQGGLYDWQAIAKYVQWLIPHKKSRGMCSETCAELLGYIEPERIDPCLLYALVNSPTYLIK